MALTTFDLLNVHDINIRIWQYTDEQGIFCVYCDELSAEIKLMNEKRINTFTENQLLTGANRGQNCRLMATSVHRHIYLPSGFQFVRDQFFLVTETTRRF